MADRVDIQVRLRGARQAAGEAQGVARGISSIGTASSRASVAARNMGGAVSSAGQQSRRGFVGIASGAGLAATGIGALAAGGVKMGLSLNAQLESARLRFELFTKSAGDADKLLRDMQQIDVKSPFNVGDLSDAAALLGNSGLNPEKITQAVQGAANAAAASGRGVQSLNSIGIALSQIAAKGRLSQEEINQLNEAGAPGAQLALQKGFKLTADQLRNVGAEGLDGAKAIDILTQTWTSGKMAKAAERQSHTLGGQWLVLTGNVQKATGAMTQSLARGLERDVLPAANRASSEITRVFNDNTLSVDQKLSQVSAIIKRDLGPVAHQIGQELEAAHLGDRLAGAVNAATPVILNAAASAAPKAAGAFIGAWLHAGPWAKLLTVAFLAKKLGAFGLLGSLAAARFRASWGLGMRAPLPGGTVAPAGGIGGASRRAGRFGRLGRFGAGAGTTLLRGAGIAGAGLLARDAARSIPALKQYSGSKGFGELARDVGLQHRQAPAATRRRRSIRAGGDATLAELRALPPSARTPAGNQEVRVQTDVHLDRERVGRSIDRRRADRQARR